MPRRYRRRSYSRSRPLKTVKYSNETTNITESLDIAEGDQAEAPLISSVDVQGVRKAKNFTLKMIYGGTTPLVWVLIYVPEGQQIGKLSYGSASAPASLYEPNQNVIMSGYLIPTYQQAQVYRTRLARNLNSGDSIYIVIKSAAGGAISKQFIGINLNYAITY